MNMATLRELRDVRIGKLDKLKSLGIDPYPAKSYKSINNIEIENEFSKLEGKKVIAAGRIIAFRKHGKLAFMDIKDATGKVQLYIKEENLNSADRSKSELNFSNLDLLDTADFVEASGLVVKTQSGQISVEAVTLRILVKALRPLPDKWDGLKDKEVRLRRRYLDTNINEEVFQRFLRRSKFWEAHRDFFKQKGFVEINIPVLEHVPGGGDANPFITHMDAIDQDFYLRISQELYLKRLIGGGYEKVYEIGPRVRNEGLSDEHLPEHIAMEFYWAYANWRDGMKMIKELYNHIINSVYEGKKIFTIRGVTVDFSKEWEEIDFGNLIENKYGFNVYDTNVKELESVFEKNNLKLNKQSAHNVSRMVDILWKHVRKSIIGPAFVINHPKYLSPLQKPSLANPKIVERFQPIIAGSELGNGWSEVNDALDQYARFLEQQKMRDAGDKEAQFLDIDYVEMLEYGMPPTFGYGHSERVFWFLEDVTAREGVPFPQLKHEFDEVTKEIYGIV